MALEENGKYETVGGHPVHMILTLEHEDMLLNYGSQLVAMLGIQWTSYKELKEKLKNEKVIHGQTNESMMPTADWHSTTGKCLGGNSGLAMGKGEELRERLAHFDIKIDTKNADSK